ncbi:MAG TPA: hypothetical protein PK294_11965 [Ignavibacteria bacterium]|nr:hypothetical protein [Ignavibacteria bacterium]HRB01142.1 hypothetical protein [Ignavibacteria bacterium]
MKLILKIFPLFILFITGISYSQSESEITLGSGFSIKTSLNYVSTATIQLNAFSESVFERNKLEYVTGGYGYGILIRKKLFRDEISFGLSAEFVSIVDDELTQTFSSDSVTIRARVTEKLTMVPIELMGYFNIPEFAEDLQIYFGGGVGVYFGNRQRSLLNIESKTLSKKPGFSLVVTSAMEYFFSRNISGVFEVRFRQGEYQVKSEFLVPQFTINGISYELEQTLNSKVFVDGLNISLGVAYNF